MNILCPDCKGSKQLSGFGCPGLKPITIPCITCRGTGEVPEEMTLAWMPLGKKMKENRRARGMSLREEAKRRRMQPSVLSEMERGVCSPIPDPVVMPK